jgi:CheY-like chemotaxis protein
LRRFLQKDGHAVKEAENGLEASEIAASEHFDLILMDVDMPICNGIESTKMIRSGDGLSKHSQIIALTGYAFEKDISKVLECGMNAHLAKPISFPKLREQIRIGFPS